MKKLARQQATEARITLKSLEIQMGSGIQKSLKRLTESALWTHVVPVRNVTTAMVALSRDNVIFGVRTVGQDGYRGVVIVLGVQL